VSARERQPATALPFAALRSLGERSGAVFGEAYARAARNILGRLERLEDLKAERKYRHRSRAVSSALPAASDGALPPTTQQPE
jgi:hypothetical protein